MSDTPTQQANTASDAGENPVAAVHQSVARTLEIEQRGLEAVQRALYGDLGVAFDLVRGA